MKTIVIGRSAHADAPLADDGVARRHVELTQADDGRWFAVDAAGPDPSGAPRTHLRRARSTLWTALRQDFVGLDDVLRLGPTAEWRIGALVAAADERRAAESGGRDDAQPGRIERDPETGEIVRRAE